MNQAAVPGADTDKGALIHPGAGKPFLERLFKECTARDPGGGLVTLRPGVAAREGQGPADGLGRRL